jgi:hypothetical protein
MLWLDPAQLRRLLNIDCTEEYYGGQFGLQPCRSWVHRTLNGVKVIRLLYNHSVEAICLISHEPDGLQASAARRGFSSPTCIVL